MGPQYARIRTRRVEEKTDVATVTMSDYTVLIQPVGYFHASDGCCSSCLGSAADGKWLFGSRHWPAIKVSVRTFRAGSRSKRMR